MERSGSGFKVIPWYLLAMATSVAFSPAGRRLTVNDPSAGSPTETLLRLLLPLNDQVWTSFRLIEASPPPPIAGVNGEWNPVQDRQSEGLTKSFNR